METENTGMTAEETSAFEEGFTDGETAPDEEKNESAEEDAERNAEAEQPEEAAEDGADGEEESEPLIEIGGEKYTKAQLEQLVSRANVREYPPVLEKLADEAGLSPEEYLAQVEDNLQNSRIEVRARQLTEQGCDEELAFHVAEIEIQNSEYKRRLDGGEAETAERENRQKEEIAEFVKRFPDVEHLPEEAAEDVIKNGLSPVDAYQKYLLKRQDVRIKQLEKENANRRNTPGAVTGQTNTENDEFLNEFMKE